MNFDAIVTNTALEPVTNINLFYTVSNNRHITAYLNCIRTFKMDKFNVRNIAIRENFRVSYKTPTFLETFEERTSECLNFLKHESILFLFSEIKCLRISITSTATSYIPEGSYTR